MQCKAMLFNTQYHVLAFSTMKYIKTNLPSALNKETISALVSLNFFPLMTGMVSQLSELNNIFSAVPSPCV